MSMNVQPDLDFIKAMKEAGGDTLKQCYQCATCSVACPLSTDDNPFPRKQMIMAQWGMREQLSNDASIFLCHQCGDCTEMCPRGARPGDVLGAIRAYAYRSLGWPTALADLCSSAKNLPMLIGIPAIVIFVLWVISGGMHIPSAEHFAEAGYTQFFGHWDFRLLAKNVLFIDIIMLTAAGIAVTSVYKGLSKMWKNMESSLGKNDVAYRPSIPQFIKQFLWPAVVEIMQHTRFKECTVNVDRVKGHKPLLLAFIGLFIVTCYSLFTQDVLGIIWPSMHGPLSMLNPVKWLANVSAIAMIVGVGILWMNRAKMEAEGKAQNTFYDWFLIWMIMGVGVTGFAAELLRLVGIPSLGYVIYYLHLISVAMLFLYMPYTKFAHIVYRTFALAFERFRESSYIKNPLNQ
ncbi:quinone-interacting membrane-bound oxidoreductase complex subunit QmoC [Desulfobulbus rhabdoformis]|uniref:quinone-interacting membrane-bound oxidoreductase complex subunit QmoC n=1 Tax=Desulfobulbus rhabdoformis TaxID=34032 RepID=UPI0019631674|nr:quinone-interacting membrane-bound oxidoreductase complex subunit QmoC [Desulfobulbus rhabdoformis]MBM9614655.1 quinone-interacting membrane-bound oxidoreductase complex subunit QmoC [Desulfobulbus rhabdoformis]